MSYSRPKDIARRMAGSSARLKSARRDAFRRETFALPREAAREKAREMFAPLPKPAYMTEIESWRELPDGPSSSPCGGCRPRINGAGLRHRHSGTGFFGIMLYGAPP